MANDSDAQRPCSLASRPCVVRRRDDGLLGFRGHKGQALNWLHGHVRDDLRVRSALAERSVLHLPTI